MFARRFGVPVGGDRRHRDAIRTNVFLKFYQTDVYNSPLRALKGSLLLSKEKRINWDGLNGLSNLFQLVYEKDCESMFSSRLDDCVDKNERIFIMEI